MNKSYSFAELYKIHCEHKIIAEKSKLESGILNKDKGRHKNDNVSNRKIKI